MKFIIFRNSVSVVRVPHWWTGPRGCVSHRNGSHCRPRGPGAPGPGFAGCPRPWFCCLPRSPVTLISLFTMYFVPSVLGTLAMLDKAFPSAAQPHFAQFLLSSVWSFPSVFHFFPPLWCFQVAPWLLLYLSFSTPNCFQKACNPLKKKVV